MKKIIPIVLLSVIITGCSSIKSEPQADNDIVSEQQTEREEQSTQGIDTAKENEISIETHKTVDYSEYFQGINGCAVVYDESSNTYSLYNKTNY